MLAIRNRSWLRQHALPLFFSLTLMVTWGCWLPLISVGGDLRIQTSGPWGLLGLLGAFAPTLVALSLIALLDGRAGLQALLERLVRWRAGVQYYIFAVLVPPLLSLGGLMLQVLLGAPRPDFTNPLIRQALPPGLAGVSLGALFLPTLIQQALLSSPIGEEPGWRGYALPLLQQRMQPLWSGVTLGLFWAIWHLPRLLTQGSAPADLAAWGVALATLLVGNVATALLFTWLFNKTHGSVLLTLLLHTSYNMAGLFLPHPTWSLEIVLTILLALLLMRRDVQRKAPGIPK